MRKLVAVREVDEFPIHDITVENDHCFQLANGVIAHNSMYPKAVVSGGCLVEGTKLRMYDGSYKEIQDIVEGDMVDTLLGSKPVTHAWNPDTLENGTPECYEVKFSDGYSVKCSENHPFLTTNRGWVEAKDLNRQLDVVFKGGEASSIVSSSSIGNLPVYDISVQDAEHYILENGVVTHNTGVMYSATEVFIISKRQEKEGKELTGFEFVINVEKSRYVKEKAKIPITVKFNGGMSRWSGLLEIALEGGFITKPKQGWYAKVDTSTGEIDGKNYRAKETNNKEFWEPILQSDEFKSYIKENYQVSTGRVLEEDGEDEPETE